MKNILFSLFLIVASAFAQAPLDKPQPNVPQFSANELINYATYDRASFEQTFGVQAPAFDVSKPAKTWFDSSVKCNSSSTKTFKALNSIPSEPSLVAFDVPTCDVSKVNLPGLPHFTAFIPNAVANIVVKTQSGQQTIFGPGVQSTLEDAAKLKAEIGDTNLQIREKIGPVVPGSQFKYEKIDAASPVGIYMLGDMNVEQALAGRNSKGVGYPGKWVKAASGAAYVFAADPAPNAGADAKYLPVPSRDLLPNEKFGFVLAGFIPTPVINRTDLGSGDSGSTSSGGGFTDADRALLQSILNSLKAITGQ